MNCYDCKHLTKNNECKQLNMVIIYPETDFIEFPCLSFELVSKKWG